MSDEILGHTQHFRQAIDTTITCRSIIKYNSTLNELQKAEILSGIDTTVKFLEARLVANTADEASAALAQTRMKSFLDADTLHEVEESDELIGERESEQDLLLKNLYRVYHSYLSGTHVTDLETRYRVIVGVLGQLEEVARLQHDTASGDLTAEHMLHRVRGFITAVYCMFREFAAVFSHIVEGKSIDMDTESLALINQYSVANEEKPQQILRDITPLMRIYATHLQFQERKGQFTRCAADAVAFLIFLEESLDSTFARYDEIIAQLKALGALLTDLTRLLAEYEQAVSSLIEV